jgi:hypothetical protein
MGVILPAQQRGERPLSGVAQYLSNDGDGREAADLTIRSLWQLRPNGRRPAGPTPAAFRISSIGQ